MGDIQDNVSEDLDQEAEAAGADERDEYRRTSRVTDWEAVDFNKLTAIQREHCYELFRRGDISWLLHPGQQEMLEWLDERRRDLAVVVTSRQWGKTTAALLYCMVWCIRHPKQTCMFIAPHKNQLQNYMMPKLNFILQFMPDDLIPTKRGMAYTFPNGSILRLDGVSFGHGARLRGDAAHLVVMDECRDISELQNIVESHISPMFTTTQGRLVMISTPPESPLHAFTDHFIREANARHDLFKATYKDNPLLGTKRLRYLLNVQHPGGEENHVFRREYMADWTVADPDKLVVREWNSTVNDEFLRTYPGPPNPVRMYIGLDFAHTDPCGIVGGYLDYQQGCLMITQEHCERKMNTDDVGLKIMEIEEKIRAEVPGALEAVRIMDVDPSLMQDLHARFGLRFEPAFKVPSVLTMLSRLRISMMHGKIIIHPRCVQLRFQLSAGVFKAKPGSTEYLRTEKGGHLDALDALKYLNLNCRWNEILQHVDGPHVGPNQIRVGGFSAPGGFRSGVISRP